MGGSRLIGRRQSIAYPFPINKQRVIYFLTALYMCISVSTPNPAGVFEMATRTFDIKLKNQKKKINLIKITTIYGVLDLVTEVEERISVGYGKIA